VSAAATIAVATVGGLFGTVWQAHVARERVREIEQLTTTLLPHVQDLTDVPGKIDSKRALVQVVAQTLEGIPRRSTRSPVVAIDLAKAHRSLAQLLGDPYAASLGDTRQAEVHARAAATMLERLAQREAATCRVAGRRDCGERER
jgi:hypothetical protein